MAVVKEFNVGNTKIKICDDCCRDKTPEQVKEAMRRAAAIVMDDYAEAAARAEKEQAAKAAEEAERDGGGPGGPDKADALAGKGTSSGGGSFPPKRETEPE